MAKGVLERPPAGGEERLDRRVGDVRERGRVPARGIVLVHDQGADALDEIALVEAAVDEVELEAEAVRERQPAAAPQLLEGDAQERGRALAEERERLGRPRLELGARLGCERLEDRRPEVLVPDRRAGDGDFGVEKIVSSFLMEDMKSFEGYPLTSKGNPD